MRVRPADVVPDTAVDIARYTLTTVSSAEYVIPMYPASNVKQTSRGSMLAAIYRAMWQWTVADFIELYGGEISLSVPWIHILAADVALHIDMNYDVDLIRDIYEAECQDGL